MPWIKNSTGDGRDILFLHIPKTGGRFITNKLLEYGDDHLKWNLPLHPIKQHYTLSDLLGNYNIDLDRTFIFSLVRHPVSKIKSSYNFCSNSRSKFKSFDSYLDMVSDKVANRSIAFNNENLTNYFNESRIDLNHIKPQREFIDFANIDVHVCRVEDQLDSIIALIKKEFSIDLSKLRYPNDHLDSISAYQRKRIMDIYEDDINYFKW